MNEWKELIGLTIAEAKEITSKAGHDIAVSRIAQGAQFKPNTTNGMPTILVTIDHPFRGCKITEINGGKIPGKR